MIKQNQNHMYKKVFHWPRFLLGNFWIQSVSLSLPPSLFLPLSPSLSRSVSVSLWLNYYFRRTQTNTHQLIQMFSFKIIFLQWKSITDIWVVTFSILSPQTHIISSSWTLIHTGTHLTNLQTLIHFAIVGFRLFVTVHVRNWCDSGGLEHTLKPKTTSIWSSPSGMVFNPTGKWPPVSGSGS